MAPNEPQTETSPLFLRPFPIADKKPKDIADFIARVNAQPGGFRALDSDSLREKAQAREDDVDEGGDGSSSEAEEEEHPKDVNAVRMAVLRNIEIAGNTAMLTLDSLSLLLSKQNPTQASLTLSQGLRDMVGIGTIGVDKLHQANRSAESMRDQDTVALGWTLMEINKTQSAAEKAAAFLKREVELESSYWRDVMEVHKAGWSICKLPQDTSALVVRYGFSEAIPEFQRGGLAPMRRGEDGSAILSLGPLSWSPKRIRVTIEKAGAVVGQSSLPASTHEGSSLQARVLEARDTIFAQELWHELVRESRQLLSYDVRLVEGRLICRTDPDSTIAIDLVDLDSTPISDSTLPENQAAEAVHMSLHLLLSYGHRYNELTRTRPMPPHIPRSRGQQTHSLLRPVIARITSLHCITSITAYVGTLVRSLKKAGFPASFTLQTPESSSLQDPNNTKTPASQTLIRNLLQAREFAIQVSFFPDLSFTLRGKTFLFPVVTTQYTITAPPESKLGTYCAPYKDGYPTLTALEDYLETATSQALAEHYLEKIQSVPDPSQDAPEESQEQSQKDSKQQQQRGDAQWGQNVRGFALRNATKPGCEMFFRAKSKDSGFVLTAGVKSEADDKTNLKRWQWMSNGDAGCESRTMDEVVHEIVKEMT